MRTVRLFVSSPSDVAPERRRVDAVVRRVQADYGDGLAIEVIRWEESFYTAKSTFQEQIDSPADVDLVLCILWKRLGSALPDEFRRPDGSSRTGTEYEFEVAMEAALDAELPDILLYRKTSEITFSASRVDQERAELQALEGFWRRWIQNEQGHFTAGFKPFESTDEFEKLLEKDLRAWLRRRFHEVTWPEAKGSPYRGLDVFDEEHAPIYFGRRRAIGEVRARLIANAERDGVGFLLIIGASGAGKSSLVRAGLIPALKETNPIEGVAGWRALVIRPAELGDDAVRGLALALAEPGVLPELLDGDFTTGEALGALWASAPGSAAHPVQAALRRWGKTLAEHDGYTVPPQTRLLLVLDQLEELLQFEADTRSAFLQIIDSLSRCGSVWVVATLRSDFYPQLFSMPELLALKDASRQYDLSIPRPRELEEIISGPARAAGLTFEQSSDGIPLEQKLLEDAEASPAALPLLEFTLERLYQERDRDARRLTGAAYERLGGLQGALTRTAEEAFDGVATMFEAAPAQVFASVMRELVAIDETRKATRRVARRERFVSADARLLVDTLVERRLLTGYTQDSADTGEPVAVVNITHEALIHHWQRLQRWLEEDQELLQVRDRTAQDCQRWLNAAGRADLLATTGKRLEEIRFLRESGLALDADTTSYIDASLTRARSIRRRRRAVQAIFGAISALALLFGVVTLNSLGELDEQRQAIKRTEGKLATSRAESAGLIAESEYAVARALRSQGDNAGALASYLRAMNQARRSGAFKHGESMSEQERAEPALDILIREASRPLWPLRELNARTRIAPGAQSTPLLAPGGEHVLLVSKDERGALARLVRVADGALRAGPLAVNASTTSTRNTGVAFSPAGTRLAIVLRGDGVPSSGDGEGTLGLAIHEVGQGRFSAAVLSGVPDVLLAEFLDESTVLLASDDGEVRAWDIGPGAYGSIPVSFTNADDVKRLQRLDHRTVLVNGTRVWRRADDAWREIYALASSGGFPAPVLPVENGFIAGTAQRDSLLGLQLAQILAGRDGLIFDYLPLRTRATITRVDLASDPPVESHTSLPVPQAYAKIPRGYLADVVTLVDSRDGPEIDAFVAMLSVEDFARTEWFHYSIDRDSGQPASPPRLVLPHDGGFHWYAGHVRSPDAKLMLVASAQGSMVLRDVLGEGNGERLRLAGDDARAWLIAPPGFESVIVANDRGAYRLDRSRLFPPNDAEALREAARRLGRPTLRASVLPAANEEDARSIDRLARFPGGNAEPGPGTAPARGAVPGHLTRVPKGFIGEPIEIRMDDRRFVIAPAGQAIEFTEGTPAGAVIRTDRAVHGYVRSSAGARIALLHEPAAVSVLDVEGAREEAFEAFEAPVRRLVVSDDGRWVAAALADSTLRVLDLRRGTSRSRPVPVDSPLTRLHISADSAVLLAGDWKGGVDLFRLGGGGEMNPFALASDEGLAISALDSHVAADRIVAAGRDGRVRLWSFSSGSPVTDELIHEGSVVSAYFSNSGEWLVTATDRDQVRVWRSEDGRLVHAIDDLGPVRQLRHAILSPDDWTLALSTAPDGAGPVGHIEVGEHLVTARVADLVDLLTRDSLWRHGIAEARPEDARRLLEYYAEPPAADASYWTGLLHLLTTCNGASACADRSALDGSLDRWLESP